MSNSNTETMRKLLLDEMGKVARGETSPSRARAVASLARGAIAAKQLEISYANFVADRGEIVKTVELVG